MVYTKEGFKKEWLKPDCAITFDDIADCAKAWGVSYQPRCCRIDYVRYRILLAAGCPDAEEYNPVYNVEDMY